jgi:hypothetical protein
MDARPGAQLRARHDLGEIIGCAWQIYARHFGTLFAVALVAAPMAMLATIIVRRVDDPSTAQLVAVYLQIPAAIIELVAVAAIVRAVDDIAQRTPPEPGRSLDTGLQKFWPIFTAQLIVGMRVILAVLAVPFLGIYWLFDREATIDGRRDWYFAVVPLALCVYLVIRWYFVPYALVVEGKRSWPALDDSADAVRGYWWRTFGIVVVIFFIRLGVTITAASVSAFAHPVIDGAVTGLVAALILPFATAAQTLLYYDLKVRTSVDLSPAPVDAP